jgi:hypothetical protein
MLQLNTTLFNLRIIDFIRFSIYYRHQDYSEYIVISGKKFPSFP